MTITVETGQHLRVREIVEHTACRCVEIEKPSLDAVHGSRARDGFGHREDCADRVGGHLNAAADGALTEATFPADAVAVDNDRGHAGNVSSLDTCG